VKAACAARAAATVAAALATGLIGTAQATPAPAGPVATAAKAVPPAGRPSVTLVTGDRVIVDAKGRVVGMERAEGRERETLVEPAARDHPGGVRR
jgi:hypothetical protein